MRRQADGRVEPNWPFLTQLLGPQTHLSAGISRKLHGQTSGVQQQHVSTDANQC